MLCSSSTHLQRLRDGADAARDEGQLLVRATQLYVLRQRVLVWEVKRHLCKRD